MTVLYCILTKTFIESKRRKQCLAFDKRTYKRVLNLIHILSENNKNITKCHQAGSFRL